MAEGIAALCRHATGRMRVTALVFAVLGVAAYIGVQALTLGCLVPEETRVRSVDVQVAGQLKRLGIVAPCLLYGRDAVQIAYYLHCSSYGVMAYWGGAQVPASIRTALATGRRVAVTARTKGGSGAVPAILAAADTRRCHRQRPLVPLSATLPVGPDHAT